MVIDVGLLERYIQHLKQHSVLAHLPFEHWHDILCEAQHWGLLTPDKDMPRFLHLQPVFPYFLQNRLNVFGQQEQRMATEKAFRELYRQVGSSLEDLLGSKGSQQRLVGQIAVRLEYENLLTALRLALKAQEPVGGPYYALSRYLEMIQEIQRGLELAQMTWTELQAYTTKEQTGPLGMEMVSLLDNLANWHRLLKQYPEAEDAYQRALALLQKNTAFDAEEIEKNTALIYHRLGLVVQGQRKWEEAEQYYHCAHVAQKTLPQG